MSAERCIRCTRTIDAADGPAQEGGDYAVCHRCAGQGWSLGRLGGDWRLVNAGHWSLPCRLMEHRKLMIGDEGVHLRRGTLPDVA